MRDQGRPYHFTVTATTRPQRPTEESGVDYLFFTREEFNHMIQKSDLLEWAEVYGNLYGVPRSQVADALEARKDVFIKADVQGAATIRTLAADAVFIFLAPPTVDELRRRLHARLTESPEVLQRRLTTAESEMREASKFDYVVVNHNGRLDEAVEEIELIVERERRREPARRVVL